VRMATLHCEAMRVMRMAMCVRTPCRDGEMVGHTKSVTVNKRRRENPKKLLVPLAAPNSIMFIVCIIKHVSNIPSVGIINHVSLGKCT